MFLVLILELIYQSSNLKVSILLNYFKMRTYNSQNKIDSAELKFMLCVRQ